MNVNYPVILFSNDPSEYWQSYSPKTFNYCLAFYPQILCSGVKKKKKVLSKNMWIVFICANLYFVTLYQTSLIPFLTLILCFGLLSPFYLKYVVTRNYPCSKFIRVPQFLWKTLGPFCFFIVVDILAFVIPNIL